MSGRRRNLYVFDLRDECSVRSALFSYLQVFIHNPHSRGVRGGRLELSDESDISLLNINQTITALAAGRLDPNRKNDILVVGTKTNVLAYDVENNQDLFYKEVSPSLIANTHNIHI